MVKTTESICFWAAGGGSNVCVVCSDGNKDSVAKTKTKTKPKPQLEIVQNSRPQIIKVLFDEKHSSKHSHSDILKHQKDYGFTLE